MKTSALRLLSFSLISLFCGYAAAFDTDAKLEELKALQAAMNQAQQDQNLPEAKRLAGEIKKLVAEFEAKRAESASVSESTPEPTPEPEPVVQQTAQQAPADKSPETVAEADQSAPYEKDFDRLVKLRDSEKTQALLPIQKRFDLAAQQLLRKAMQTGNLDAANKIKASIENPPDLATLRQEASTPMDRELLRLAEQREKETAIASAPAQKRFDLATQQLLRKVTQTGNLEAANELKERINASNHKRIDPFLLESSAKKNPQPKPTPDNRLIKSNISSDELADYKSNILNLNNRDKRFYFIECAGSRIAYFTESTKNQNVLLNSEETIVADRDFNSFLKSAKRDTKAKIVFLMRDDGKLAVQRVAGWANENYGFECNDFLKVSVKGQSDIDLTKFGLHSSD